MICLSFPLGRMLQQNYRGGGGLGGGTGGLAGALGGGGLVGSGMGGGGGAPPLQPLQQPVRGYQPNFGQLMIYIN